MEHQLATKSNQKEQSKKLPFSFSLQQVSHNQATTHPLLRLQRTIGNQAVQNMVRSRGVDEQLQRSPSAAESPSTIPPIVHNVLRSPGQPLAPATRTFME